MAISDSSITSVELTNTFEQWRSKTNQIITVLNEQSDYDPSTALLSSNSVGGLSINTITSNVVTGANVTGSKLLFSGGTVDFTGATTTDLGTVEKFALVETVGATVTGASPDSKIERCQINEVEINLNGKNLSANGASTINLNGATVSDLGTVSQVTVSTGTLNDVNVNITDSSKVISITAGDHILTGATFGNGTFNNTYTIGGFTHSANISVNASSALVANVGAIFGSDVGTSNVAIGNFPEYTSSPTAPTSSKGRLHIRSAFANSGSSATAVGVVSDELILENTDNVGMTLLSSNTSNAHIAFGDSADVDVGGFVYNHDTDSLHIVTEAANTAVFANTYGGSLQIVGGDTYSAAGQAGKLHVNVGSSDGTTGIFLDSNDVDQIGISIDAAQTTANIFEINSDTATSGHVMAIHHGLGTGTSHAMTGSMLSITDNNSSTSARAVVDINQDATGASGSLGLRITADGGEGIQLLQNSVRTAMNVESSNAHSTSLIIFKSADTSSTGATLYVHGATSTGGTKILHVANNSADIFNTYANGSIYCTGPILSNNGTDTVNARLPVRDSGGTVVNTT
jgi:hypothetical protein